MNPGLLKIMANPKDDGTGGRIPDDIGRRFQDQHNLLEHRQLKPKRLRRWHFVLGGVVIAIGVLAAVWDWDWFRPLVARKASAALGRTVTLQHFDLRLGRLTAAVADGVRIANPTGFSQDPPLAAVERLTVTIDTMELLRHRAVVVPDILIEQPQIAATQAEDGSANYLFPALSSGGDSLGAKLGNLRITGGQAHVVLARLRADFNVVVETRVTDGTPQVVAHATGILCRATDQCGFRRRHPALAARRRHAVSR